MNPVTSTAFIIAISANDISASQRYSPEMSLGCYLAIPHLSVQSLEDKIDRVCSDPDNFEEDENCPSEKAIDSLKNLLKLAETELNESLPGDGHIAPYFGELSITWTRESGKMLRIATFSDDREPTLIFGTSSASARGKYTKIVNPSGTLIAEKLQWLSILTPINGSI